MTNMSNEISINISHFKGVTRNMKTTMNQVDCKVDTNESFDKTNLAPFTENLEVLIELISTLDEYKALFDRDIDILNSVGESLQEKDEQLATSTPQAGGNQPLRA